MEDHRLAALPLALAIALALLAMTVPVGGCSKGSLAGDSGSPVAGEAGTLMACNDGTEEQHCCPGSVASGVACTAAGPVQCWTRCAGGYRGQFVCSDGTWLAGLGLFPCAADASVDAVDAVDGSDMAHGCRPGSADCGPVGTWSCTPQHACCMGGGSDCIVYTPHDGGVTPTLAACSSDADCRAGEYCQAARCCPVGYDCVPTR